MSMTSDKVRAMLANAGDVQVQLSAAIATRVCQVAERARQRGEDRSFEYWVEETIEAGADAKIRSWDYSDRTRNDREFADALKASQIKFKFGSPATLEDSVKYAELCVKYKKYDATEQDVVELKKQLAQANQKKAAA